MSFNTTPIPGPQPVASSTTSTLAAADARARAIAKLTGAAPQQSQETPVLNPSKVTPEEMTAVSPKKEEEETPEALAATGQNDTVDAPQAPKEVTAPPEVPLSSQYAQLARKEKQIRAQVNAVKAQEAAIKAREDAIKAKEAEMQSQYVPKDRIAKDPLKVLMEQGYSSEQITQMLLNAPDPAQQQQQAIMDELRAEIKALKDGQESAKKTFEDSQTQAYQQAVNNIRAEAKQLVTKDDAYETIRATESEEDVVDLITKTFKVDGVLLTVEEAAQAVEEYLVEEGVKIAALKKIQSRLKPAVPASAPQQTQKQPMKTLTNTMGNTRSLTAKERAILAFKGELK